VNTARRPVVGQHGKLRLALRFCSRYHGLEHGNSFFDDSTPKLVLATHMVSKPCICRQPPSVFPSRRQGPGAIAQARQLICSAAHRCHFACLATAGDSQPRLVLGLITVDRPAQLPMLA